MRIAVVDRNGNPYRESGVSVTAYFEDGATSSGRTDSAGIATIDISERQLRSVTVGGQYVSCPNGRYGPHDTVTVTKP
jgi:hypothetical protein